MDNPRNASSPSDEDTIETSPELWLDEYGDELFRAAMVRLGDRAAALDAVQETFLAAMTGVADGKFDRRGDFRFWLRAILRNKVIDHIRKRSREQLIDTSEPEGLGDSVLYKLTGIPTTAPHDWAFDVEIAFEREEFWAAFENCMSGLSEVSRAVFTMKVLDGVGTEQICSAVGISPNYMGVVLHRARVALKRCLESKWFIET